MDVVVPKAKWIKRSLAAHKIRRAEAKKRGTKVGVTTMVRRLSGRDDDAGIVLFSPVLGRYRAIVAQRTAVTF